MSDLDVQTAAAYVLGHVEPHAHHIQPGSFYDALLGALFKADQHNRALLGLGFPMLADMVGAYKNDTDGVDRLRAAETTGEWT